MPPTDAELHESLNPSQREAVEHVAGPVLVLAGAGSGKTRVLTLRIARLIEEQGIPADRILAVTFTNKAAGEMKERVGRLLGRDPAGLWIGTFHSLSARLLRREAEVLGFTRQFTIYDEDDRNALVGRLLDDLGFDKKKMTPRAIAGIISGAKNRMVEPDELARSSGFDLMVKAAAAVYERLGPALKAANAMDFDDLLLHPVKLFHEHPDRLEVWRRRFQFILVDEFQDTNIAQYRLIRFLGLPLGNVMAVGDDDQSIYGWRGANVGNMREFQEDFRGTRLVRLELNYRSTQVVLDAANRVIAENKGRLGKTLTTTRAGGEMITVVAAADERDEAEWVVRELQARRQDWDYSAMAVLYRTRSQSRVFEEAFRRAGVPFRLIGAIPFTDRREVKDLLAYPRLMINPKDDEAFLRAIGMPKRGIGESSLNHFTLAARGWKRSLLESARNADAIPELGPKQRAGFKAFAELIDRLAEFAQVEMPAPVLERLVDAIDYEKVLLEEGAVEGGERVESVNALISWAAEWADELATEGVQAEDSEGSPLGWFLERAALLTGSDKTEGDEAGVTMMTLHTAKGLEWPVVVLAGMVEGLFPLSRDGVIQDLEEERRLAYVGITRSRDKLYVTWSRSRRWAGRLMPSMMSQFVLSLPSDRVEEKQTALMFAPFGRRSGGQSGGRSDGWNGGWGSKEAKPNRSALGGGDWRPPEWATATDPSPSHTPVPQAAEEESQTAAPRMVKGERVRHRKHGSGVIRGLNGVGRAMTVEVEFADPEIGIRKLLAENHGLERDDDWESA